MTFRDRRARTPRSIRSVSGEIILGSGAYGVALGLLLLTFLVISVQPGHRFADLIGTVLAILALTVTLRAAGALNHPFIYATIGAVLLVAVLRAVAAPEDRAVGSLSQLVLAALAVTGPLAVTTDLVNEREVSPRAIAGALCLYLLVGVSFAFLFGAMQYISGEPFFANRPQATTADFLYFSLATLTTTGFGDFVAGAPMGRTVAVLEAIFGQLWLVTIVAGLVGAAAIRKIESVGTAADDPEA
jgi:hypothetical protein